MKYMVFGNKVSNMRVKKIKIQMSNKVAKLLVILLLFALVNYYSINIVSDNNTNSLRLSVNSLEYEFESLFNGHHSVFDIFTNITIENTSSENITVGFGDTSLWDTQVDCILANKSLEIAVYEGTRAFVNVFITFLPGLTTMVDYAELHVYGYKLSFLPEGSYKITIGEDHLEYYEEIKGPAIGSFSVNDKHELSFSENPNFLSFSEFYLLIPACTILMLVYRRFTKRK